MRLIRTIITFATALSLSAVVGAVAASPAHAATKSCSASSPVAQRPTLYKGDTGSCVKVAQNVLVREGLLGKSGVDGQYGSKTEAATQTYQARRGISTTGNWGPLTWRSSTKPRPVTLDSRAVRASKKNGLAVDINTTEHQVRVLRHGKIVLTVDARFGGVHPDPDTGKLKNYPTDKGVFRSYRKGGADYRSNSFEDGDGKGALMPYPWFFNGGEAVHYSPGFAREGYNGSSHGCVNLRSRDIAKQINDLPLGTVVVVH